MKLLIDIQTPTGKSLEGFPQAVNTIDDDLSIAFMLDEISLYQFTSDYSTKLLLNSGDTLTIKIL